MKSALKSASTLGPARALMVAVRRWLAWYAMRSLEINLAGAIDTLPGVRDPDTRAAMKLAIKAMSKELCRARARYQYFLPPGERIVWDIA